MPKTVKINGVFEVVDASTTVSPKAVMNEQNTQIGEVTNYAPWLVPGNSVNEQITFGGITLAKRIYLHTDQPVTLKFNQNTDVGFSFGPGHGIFSSQDGITAIFVSTGPNPTNVTAIIGGD